MKWIMLINKLPRAKTTAVKVSVWRKLKKLGAYPLQDSVFILPFSERTLEHFEWLSQEIKEMGGDASLWETVSIDSEQEHRIKEFFIEQVNREYSDIIDSVREAENIKQLQRLWTRFHRVKTQDYLRSPLWIEVKSALENRAAQIMGEDDVK
ncbi:MAG: Chromate resistance protein ChrB [Bacillota bacterium]